MRTKQKKEKQGDLDLVANQWSSSAFYWKKKKHVVSGCNIIKIDYKILSQNKKANSPA